jgi:hypothetical protein
MLESSAIFSYYRGIQRESIRDFFCKLHQPISQQGDAVILLTDTAEILELHAAQSKGHWKHAGTISFFCKDLH